MNVCIVSAHLHNLFEILLIGDELSELVSYVLQAVGASLAYSELKVTVALAVELALDLLIGLVGECSVDAHEVGYAGLFIGSVAYNGVGVGYGSLELTHNIVLGVEDTHYGVLVGIGLRHLSGGLLE